MFPALLTETGIANGTPGITRNKLALLVMLPSRTSTTTGPDHHGENKSIPLRSDASNRRTLGASSPAITSSGADTSMVTLTVEPAVMTACVLLMDSMDQPSASVANSASNARMSGRSAKFSNSTTRTECSPPRTGENALMTENPMSDTMDAETSSSRVDTRVLSFCAVAERLAVCTVSG